MTQSIQRAVAIAILLVSSRVAIDRPLAQSNSPLPFVKDEILSFRCPPGNVQSLTEAEPTSTEFGTAGLVIDQPGCYFLTKDLSIPSSFFYGILILGRHITLDLNGYTITGGRPRFDIGVIGPEGVTIRNGTLSNGEDGVFAAGEWEGLNLGRTSLRIERMSILLGPSTAFNAIRTVGVDYLEILSSTALGVDLAVWVEGESTGRIVNSTIRATEEGLRATHFQGGEIRSNFIEGDDALCIGDRNVLEGNTIDGGPFGVTSVEVRGAHNRLIGNTINAGGAMWGVRVNGDENIVEDNLIVKAFSAALSINSDRNRIRRNLIREATTGVEVRGSRQVIDDNFISRTQCGLQFFNDDAHMFRDNVVLEASEGACGVAGDGGRGNVFPASTCGNGLRGGTEVCDSPDLGGETCSSLGFRGGVLSCSSTCDGFDPSRCTR